MDSVICQAIANKFLLEFIYDGIDRIVEPHTYGLTSKGHVVLSAFQIRADSDIVETPSWKLFKESKIKGLSIVQENFLEERPEYKKNDSRMIEIFCEL